MIALFNVALMFSCSKNDGPKGSEDFHFGLADSVEIDTSIYVVNCYEHDTLSLLPIEDKMLLYLILTDNDGDYYNGVCLQLWLRTYKYYPDLCYQLAACDSIGKNLYFRVSGVQDYGTLPGVMCPLAFGRATLFKQYPVSAQTSKIVIVKGAYIDRYALSVTWNSFQVLPIDTNISKLEGFSDSR
ncbi:hypothetical protein F9K33_03280 [bacterium]|nr:MAG: hypothetical protein F9K33_03280 [bacterium]